MNASSLRRAFALTVIAGLVAFAVPAASQTAVQHHSQARKESVRDLRQLRTHHRRNVHRLRRDIRHTRVLIGFQKRVDSDRWSVLGTIVASAIVPNRHWASKALRHKQRMLARENRTWRHRSRKLTRRVRKHGAWLGRFGLFEVCPVPGYSVIHDDFGEMVRVDGVEPHVHMGSDVEAPYGARIVAPFDGRAEASWSPLGGIQVRVYGARGYVYNAHLSAYGRTGYVHAGDTVGYVGSTGLSTAPHDHIEWHPGDGGAVDPYVYLALSCLG